MVDKKPNDNMGMQALDGVEGGELMGLSKAAGVVQEVQAAVLLARHFPRDEKAAWAKLMQACKRKTLAKVAAYNYPRGGKNITGPSVNLVRPAAAAWGNIRFGLEILRSDRDEVLIQGFAWDLESNTYVPLQDRFKKLIFRKGKGWIVPDERDLRELINRRGAILTRNCLLMILPRDLIEDALGVADQTLKSEIKDPASEQKKLILQFDKWGVTVEMLNKYIGATKWSKDDLVQLIRALQGLENKETTREELFGDHVSTKGAATSKLNNEDMKPGDASKHQGHEPPSTTSPPTAAPPADQTPPADQGAPTEPKQPQAAQQTELDTTRPPAQDKPTVAPLPDGQDKLQRLGECMAMDKTALGGLALESIQAAMDCGAIEDQFADYSDTGGVSPFMQEMIDTKVLASADIVGARNNKGHLARFIVTLESLIAGKQVDAANGDKADGAPY